MRIFISSPYSNGNTITDPDALIANVNRSIDAAEELSRRGHTPFLPLLSHYWQERFQHDHAFWLEWCLKWLNMCDAMLRLDGVSKGANDEEREAVRMGMDIFRSIDEVPERCGRPASRSISVDKIDSILNELIDIELPTVGYDKDVLVMANRIIEENARIARRVRLILEGMDECPDVDEIV